MSLNVFLDSFGGNTVAALADGNKLLEYHVEKTDKSQIVGNIYKGRVNNVLSGMQAAFVDIGLKKNGYLFVGETLVDKKLIENSLPSTLNLSENDVIMVQAVKDPTGQKGARLTDNISLPGRYVVYVPTLDYNTVSRKITDESIRNGLIEILGSIKIKQGGFIARTASENAKKNDIKIEAKNLVKQYEEILENYEKANVGEVVYNEGDLPMRMVRDVLTSDVEKIIIADKNIYDRLKKLPHSREKIRKKLYFFDEKTDMFKKYGLDKDVDGLLRSRVDLSSGAYLIIDRTEALTVIDVNTGSYIGEEKLEETVFATNLLAAEEIARQVRLRNIGGIVVVDFIDMELEEHRQKLVDALTEFLKNDRLKCNVVGMTGLGIVEFTRRKKRKEINEILNKKCPYCKGEGKILADDYIIMKIRTALLDIFGENYKSAIIDLNAEICDTILKTGVLSKDVQKFWQDKRIYLVPHKTYHQEYFNVKGDNNQILNLSDKAVLLY